MSLRSIPLNWFLNHAGTHPECRSCYLVYSSLIKEEKMCPFPDYPNNVQQIWMVQHYEDTNAGQILSFFSHFVCFYFETISNIKKVARIV